MGQFFEELKRRNVLRVAAGYVVASWLIIQVVETIFPAFGFGDAAVRIVTIVLAIGLIPALILAWAFEITPEGLKKEKDVDRSKIDPQRTKTLDRLIIVVLTLGVGYFAFDKFILDPVRDVEMIEEAKEVARSEVLVRSYGSRSIAVLPFVNLSADPEQEYFSEGISEELLNLLAKIPELRVISRSSAFSFKTQNVDIPTFAKQVNVAYVLEGSVRKSGNNIRITAQLIDALTDTHLWSKTYDRTLDDIFAVQDEIANKVVSQMKVELLGPLPKVKKVDPQAYAMVLRATYLINQVDPALFAKAEGLLQNALAIDPDYTDALGTLGRIYSLRDGPNEDGFALVQDIIDRILAIDPNDGNAIGWLVWMALFRDNDLASCAAHLERALVLAPTDVQILRYSVLVLLTLGHKQDAITIAEYVVDHDPLCRQCHYYLERAYYTAGHYDEAEAAARAGLILVDSGGLLPLYRDLGRILLLKGNPTAALEAFEKESRFEHIPLYGKALALHDLGQQVESEQAFKELRERFAEQTALIAQVYAWRGDRDAAFTLIDKMKLKSSDQTLRNEFISPIYEKLHDDPRWQELLVSLGIAKEQLAEIDFQMTLPQA